MKKIYGVLILAVSVLFFACCNLFVNDTMGKILIQLPGNNSGKSRNVIEAGADTTEYYAINLEGPTPKTLRVEGGGAVTIEDLQLGTYTVTVEAYSKESFCLSTKSATVEVIAGETAEVNLSLPKNIFANTNFTWWNYENYDSNTTSNSYNKYQYTISSEKPSSASDLTVSSSSFQAYSANVIEDNEGVTYYLEWYENGCYLTRYDVTSSLNLMEFTGIAPCICYDEIRDIIYSYVSENSNTLTRLEGKAARTAVKLGVFDPAAKSYSITLPGVVSGSSLECFAVRDDDAYFVFEKAESDTQQQTCVYNTIYKVKFGEFVEGVIDEETGETTMGTANISSCVKVETFSPSRYSTASGVSNVRGEITDITIASDGTAYALILDQYFADLETDTSSTSPEDSTKNQTAYSRGAIAKITSDGKVEYLGYHTQKRELTAKNYDKISEMTVGAVTGGSLNSDYMAKMNLYAPTLSQSEAEFYGPQKIIAKKPDELYIVDCGVNFLLADFNPDDYHAGNAYLHDRIVKVDLKTFALSIVQEKRQCAEYEYEAGNKVTNNCLFTNYAFASAFFIGSLEVYDNPQTGSIPLATLEDEE